MKNHTSSCSPLANVRESCLFATNRFRQNKRKTFNDRKLWNFQSSHYMLLQKACSGQNLHKIPDTEAHGQISVQRISDTLWTKRLKLDRQTDPCIAIYGILLRKQVVIFIIIHNGNSLKLSVFPAFTPCSWISLQIPHEANQNKMVTEGEGMSKYLKINAFWLWQRPERNMINSTFSWWYRRVTKRTCQSNYLSLLT